jgi:hypothetical protein
MSVPDGERVHLKPCSKASRKWELICKKVAGQFEKTLLRGADFMVVMVGSPVPNCEGPGAPPGQFEKNSPQGRRFYGSYGGIPGPQLRGTGGTLGGFGLVIEIVATRQKIEIEDRDSLLLAGLSCQGRSPGNNCRSFVLWCGLRMTAAEGIGTTADPSPAGADSG